MASDSIYCNITFEIQEGDIVIAKYDVMASAGMYCNITFEI